MKPNVLGDSDGQTVPGPASGFKIYFNKENTTEQCVSNVIEFEFQRPKIKQTLGDFEVAVAI